MFDKLDQDTIETIKKMWKWGYSRDYIARELEVSTGVVSKYCQGIPRGAHANQPQPRRQPKSQVQNQIEIAPQHIILESYTPETRKEISDEKKMAVFKNLIRAGKGERVIKLDVDQETITRVAQEASYYLSQDRLWWPPWLKACYP